MTEIEDRTSGRSRKGLAEAVLAFQTQPRELASETRRKYKLTLKYLNDFCEKEGVRYVDQAGIDVLDRYALWRNKTNWTWIQEVEILHQSFGFCMDREWTTRNPAKALKRP